MNVKKNYRELPFDIEGAFSTVPKFRVEKKYEVEIETMPVGEAGLVPSEAATFVVTPKSPLQPGEYLLASTPTGDLGVDFGVIAKK